MLATCRSVVPDRCCTTTNLPQSPGGIRFPLKQGSSLRLSAIYREKAPSPAQPIDGICTAGDHTAERSKEPSLACSGQGHTKRGRFREDLLLTPNATQIHPRPLRV